MEVDGGGIYCIVRRLERYENWSARMSSLAKLRAHLSPYVGTRDRPCAISPVRDWPTEDDAG